MQDLRGLLARKWNDEKPYKSADVLSSTGLYFIFSYISLMRKALTPCITYSEALKVTSHSFQYNWSFVKSNPAIAIALVL